VITEAVMILVSFCLNPMVYNLNATNYSLELLEGVNLDGS
jgi:hypothetical protein